MCALRNQNFIKAKHAKSNPGQPWTASRRHRMLRSLQNRINMIRAVIQKQALDATKKPRSASTDLKRSSSSIEDLEYIPGRPKRARVTYTKRSRPNAVPLLVETPPRPQSDAQSSGSAASRSQRINFRAPVTPGRIPLQTPVVRKIRQFDTPNRPPPPQFDPKTPKGRLVSCTADIKSVQLRMDGPLYCQYECLLRVVDSITSQACPSKAGDLSKSLLGMCMRNITNVIARLEEQRAPEESREESKSILEDSNCTTEMYSHLEAMNPYVPGWTPLRLFILREATEMLRDAILEGLIIEPFTQILIQKFAAPDLLSEATVLLKAIVDISYPSPSDEDARIPTPIGILYDFCKRNHYRDLLFQILEPLLFSSQLPTKWLSTSAFAPIWSEAIAALGNPAPCRPVMDFVGMALFQLSRVAGYCPAPAAQAMAPQPSVLAQTAGKTLASVLGILVGLALVGHKKQVDGRVTSRSVTRRIVFLLTHCTVFAKNQARRSYFRDSVSLFAFATFLAGHMSTDLPFRSWPEVMTLSGANLASSVTPNLADAVYSMAMSMVCTAAHGCSVGSTNAPHHYLVSLCNVISPITLCGRPLTASLQDGARLLSNQTGDLRDIAFAETQETPSGVASAQSVQPGKRVGRPAAVAEVAAAASSMYSGYQWDEALSEWVECTGARTKKTRATRAKTSRSLSSQGTCAESLPTSSQSRMRSRITVEIPMNTFKGKFTTTASSRSVAAVRKRFRDYSSDGEYHDESNDEDEYVLGAQSEGEYESSDGYKSSDGAYESEAEHSTEFQSDMDDADLHHQDMSASPDDDENDDDELSETFFSFSAPASRQPTPVSASSSFSSATKRIVKSLPVRQALSRVTRKQVVTLTTMGGAWNDEASEDDLL